MKGHAHSTNQHWYKKIDGEWKFAGLNPEIRWSEFDFDKVFQEGRENFGDKAEVEVKVEEKRNVEAEKTAEVLQHSVEVTEKLEAGQTVGVGA